MVDVADHMWDAAAKNWRETADRQLQVDMQRAAVGGFETERDDLTDNQGELPIKLPRKELTVVK